MDVILIDKVIDLLKQSIFYFDQDYETGTIGEKYFTEVKTIIPVLEKERKK